MRRSLVSLACVLTSLSACGHAAQAPSGPSRPPRLLSPAEPGLTGATASAVRPTARAALAQERWVGAELESAALAVGATEADLGVWVDVPDVAPARRAPLAVALVVDTSGSMDGPKIDNARRALRLLVQGLADGDVVSVDTFADEARSLVTPTVLDAETRGSVLAAIERMPVAGSTNLFDGLQHGERHAAAAPQTHAVRRVIVLSDGRANVGPVSPQALGAVAEQGLRQGAQVTSLGVGLDYDETTLNALAVRSSGRLYHLGDPREMASILRGELALLSATVASDAFVEVVPARGVDVHVPAQVGATRDGQGTIRIPLGALHRAQSREALLHVRLPSHWEGQSSRALASVRLHLRDPFDGVERVQEIVSEARFTTDREEVASTASSRTRTIAAIQASGEQRIAAAADVNEGRFDEVDARLARAEKAVVEQRRFVRDRAQADRLDAQHAALSQARGQAQQLRSAPAPARRSEALKMNKAGMGDFGF